jgi:hypothetical protein
MAIFNGQNYEKVYVNKPSEKAGTGEYNGHVKVLYDEFVAPQDILAGSDIIRIGRLPRGARIVGGRLKSGDLGTAGALQFGVTGVAQGICTTTTATSAVQKVADGVSVGEKFEDGTEVFVTVSTATDGAEGEKIQAWVEYIVD